MQKLIYVRRSHGVSKKGKNYDITEVSDGLATFMLSNTPGIGDDLENSLEKGDEFMAEVHVSTEYGSLRGEIVKVAKPA